MIMNLINIRNNRGKTPYFINIRLIIKSYFGAELLCHAAFIYLRKSEGLNFEVQLTWMEFLVISKVDDIGPNQFFTPVFENIYYTFHFYRLYKSA
jgi:hypothetical protein